MSLSGELCLGTVERIRDELGLVEVTAADGGPFLPIPLAIPGAEGGGCLRVWKGKGLERMVYVGLAFKPAQLDSHMVFAFTGPESAVPHYTVDSVSVMGHYSIHCDLIPRAELAANRAYMDGVFHPLSAAWDEADKLEGHTPAQLGRRQYAIMSPWMMVGRYTEEAFRNMTPLCARYTDHWLGLMKNGVPEGAAPALDGATLAARDAANRTMIFDPEIDKVWDQIRGMIGDTMVEKMRGILKSETAL